MRRRAPWDGRWSRVSRTRDRLRTALLYLHLESGPNLFESGCKPLNEGTHRGPIQAVACVDLERDIDDVTRLPGESRLGLGLLRNTRRAPGRHTLQEDDRALQVGHPDGLPRVHIGEGRGCPKRPFSSRRT